MKRLLLLTILLTSVIWCKGQTPTKKDTTKPKYQYFVKLPVNDYQQLAQALNEYKRLSMYDPNASADQKVKVFQGIEGYLKELPSRVKVDSIKVGAK